MKIRGRVVLKEPYIRNGPRFSCNLPKGKQGVVIDSKKDMVKTVSWMAPKRRRMKRALYLVDFEDGGEPLWLPAKILLLISQSVMNSLAL